MTEDSKEFTTYGNTHSPTHSNREDRVFKSPGHQVEPGEAVGSPVKVAEDGDLSSGLGEHPTLDEEKILEFD